MDPSDLKSGPDLRPHQGVCFTTINHYCEKIEEEADRMRARGRRLRFFFITLHGDSITVGFVSALMETPLISDLDDLRPHQGLCFTTIAHHWEEVEEKADWIRSVGSKVAASGNHTWLVAENLDRATMITASACDYMDEAILHKK
ncbi:hypothetical protein Droror1_Dr00017012 [Drosera rotundifolia]